MFVFLLLLLLTVSPAFAAGQPVVTGLHLQEAGDMLEIVISASGDIQPRLVQYVNPSKVILELPGAALSPDVKAPKAASRAVKGVRVSQNGSGAKVAVDFEYAMPQAKLIDEEPGRIALQVPTVFQEARSVRVNPGIYYKQVTRGTPQGPLEINILEIDPKMAEVTVETRLANSSTLGREALSSITAAAGALAAVNGSFFGADGTPLGLYIEEGRLITEPILGRSALAVTADGQVLISPFDFSGRVKVGYLDLTVSGLNRQRYADELIVYTRDRGETTKTNSFGYELVILGGVVVTRESGNASIPENGYVLSGHGYFKEILKGIPVGTRSSLKLETIPDYQEMEIQFAVGAGPMLVHQGKVKITAKEESFKSDITQGRAPRTAVGVTAAGKIIAVTVNGRKAGVSIGMTLDELAQLLVELGCSQAVNLDGGGSATMVIRNKPLNMPSDGRERQVSSAVLFFVNSNKGSY